MRKRCQRARFSISQWSSRDFLSARVGRFAAQHPTEKRSSGGGWVQGAVNNQKTIQNRTFGKRSALGPSKSDIWKGVWKKNEHLMNVRCKNRCIFMAQNYVWRYTLCLFCTFVTLRKNNKNKQNGIPTKVMSFDSKSYPLGVPGSTDSVFFHRCLVIPKIYNLSMLHLRPRQKQ